MSSDSNDAKPWQDKETLERLFIEEDLNQSEVAERLGTSNSTIRYWRNKHEIVKPWKDEETLRELYFEKGLTTEEIGNKLGCSDVTVQRWMKKHDLDINKRGTYKRDREERWHDEETLRRLYLEEDLSQAEIGERLGCTAHTIWKWMKKYDIPINDARGKGDLSAADTPATFTHKTEGPNEYEIWSSDSTHLYVHRLVAVAEYGVDAVKDKVVHHRNGIPWDNRPGNLAVTTPREHRMMHVSQE